MVTKLAGLSADEVSTIVSILRTEVNTFSDSDGHWGGYAAGCQRAIDTILGIAG